MIFRSPSDPTAARSVDFSSYPAKDRPYLQAHQEAKGMLDRLEIRAFSVEHCRERGRLIHFESDQGWNPDPFFQEFEPDIAEPEIPN